MKDMKIMNSKEKRGVMKMLEKQFGFKEEIDYVFLKDHKEKIYLISPAISEIDLSKLHINSMGMYFAEARNGEIRLSIEGSQLIGPHVEKNVVELPDDAAEEWLKGIDIDYVVDKKGFVIIKNKKDYYGTGKVKENKILNYVPKIRRSPRL